LNNDDPEAIRKAAEDLMTITQQIGASMYQAEPNPTAAAGDDATQQQDGGEPQTPGDDDVVDGEFKNA